MGRISLILQIRNFKIREGEYLAQSHTTSKSLYLLVVLKGLYNTGLLF